MLLNRQIGFGAFHHMTMGSSWATDFTVHLFKTSFPLPNSCSVNAAIQWCWRQSSAINPLSSHWIWTENMSFSRTEDGSCLISFLYPNWLPSSKGKKSLRSGTFDFPDPKWRHISQRDTSVWVRTQVDGIKWGINIQVLSLWSHHMIRPGTY